MAKPYSYDFRQKVIVAIEVDGRKKGEVSEVFNISRNTINLWLNRKKQTGDCLPEPNRPPGNNHKITDWKKFTEFASGLKVPNPPKMYFYISNPCSVKLSVI